MRPFFYVFFVLVLCSANIFAQTQPPAEPPVTTQVSPAASPTQPIPPPIQAVVAPNLPTQMGLDGTFEADVKQAKVDGGVLTIVVLYRNTSTQKIDVRYPLSDVYTIDKRENKKYAVLKDEKGDWIAAPVARGSIGIDSATGASPLEIEAGQKKAIWFKFPAPPAGSTTIDLIVPNIIPFEGVTIGP